MRGGKAPALTRHAALLLLVAAILLASVAHAQTLAPAPVIPAPVGPPVAPAQPAAPAATAPPVQPVLPERPPPLAGPLPSPPATETTSQQTISNSGKPTLTECRYPLRRMLGFFLFELLCEFGMLVLRFLVDTEVLDWELTYVAYARLGYAALLIIINFSALSWGAGRKRICMATHSELKLVFAILMIYTIFALASFVFVFLEARDEDSDYDDSYDDDRRSSRRRRQGSESGYGSDDSGSGRKFNLGRLFGLGR